MFSAMVASLSGILEIPIYLNLLRALAQDGRSIGAGQHSKPKDRFLLVFFSPLFLFFSISLERPVAAFAASKERACENLRNY